MATLVEPMPPKRKAPRVKKRRFNMVVLPEEYAAIARAAAAEGMSMSMWVRLTLRKAMT